VTASLFHEADTVILVCAKSGLATPPEGRGLIVQNLMLAAHDLGLGSSPVGLARPWFNQAHVKAELGIPAHYEVVLPIALGHPVLPLPCHPKNEPEIACWNWDD
jgi:nitroreductase